MIRGKTISPLICVGILALVLASCSVEMKLGKEFRENWQDTVAVVFTPDYVFKQNLKTYDLPGADSMPEAVKDSALLANSLFLKDISDSAVLAKFRSSFTDRLRLSGFRVLDPSELDRLMTEHRKGLLVNIAQISLEEFVHPYSFDYEMTGEYLTVSDIDLNAVSFNVWLELSQLNSENHHKVLFASDFTTDEVEGYFRQFIFTGEIKFEYTIDTLSVSVIYKFIESLGEKYADQLYDYFLNGYIRDNVSKNYPLELKGVHWNPERQSLQFREQAGQFLELDQE